MSPTLGLQVCAKVLMLTQLVFTSQSSSPAPRVQPHWIRLSRSRSQMFPFVTSSHLRELALLICCSLEAQDNRRLSLISILLSLFCQLTKRTSERVPRAGIWRLWTFSKMIWFSLITKVHAVRSQGKYRPKLTLQGYLWGLYEEHRPCLSLDLPALVIHMWRHSYGT